MAQHGAIRYFLGGLEQQSCRMAAGVAHHIALFVRIGQRLVGQPRELEGATVQPLGVLGRIVDDHRPIFHRLIEQRVRGGGRRLGAEIRAADQDAITRVGRRVSPYRLDERLRLGGGDAVLGSG
jgi:hypothetical protein